MVGMSGHLFLQTMNSLKQAKAKTNPAAWPEGGRMSKTPFSSKELEKMWQNLGDVPINPETECLEAPFLEWGIGTHREIIWHWFDRQHSKGVAFLMYGPP